MTTSRKDSLVRRFLTAAVLAAGFGTVWFIVTVWLGVSILDAGSKRGQTTYERVIVADDGEPLIMSYPLDNLSQATVRDLAGAARDDAEGNSVRAIPLYGDATLPRGLSRLGRVEWPSRIKVFRNDLEPAALWYFIHDGAPDGSGGFVGYERVSNRLIGHIGLAGFREGPLPPEERIPVRGDVAERFSNWSSLPIHLGYEPNTGNYRSFPGDVLPRLVHVPSGNALRVVDLAARTVETVFETAEPILSVGVPSLAMYTGSEATWERPILVRTAGKVYKLDHQYKLLGTSSMPNGIAPQDSLSWYEAEGGRSTIEYNLPVTAVLFGGDVRNVAICRLSPDGVIQETREVALRTGSERRKEWQEAVVIGLCLPSPAALAATGWLSAPANVTAQDRASLLRRLLPALAATILLSILLAAAAWRRSRTFGLSGRERATWAVFVLLFGLPAFVGFLLHRRWPARIPCPHCRAQAPRDRDACAECAEPFPEPALLGTEIFA